jgi:hypothetical protein
MKYVLFLLIAITNVAFAPPHPFHFGVAELTYNAQKNTFEISCKLFTNDLESILKKKYGKQIDLIKSHEEAWVMNMLQQYVQEHFVLNNGLQNINYTLLGSEHEDSALWMYFESQTIAAPQAIYVHNSLLFDLFDDQANIIHININGHKRSYKLQNPTSSQLFSF